MAAHAPYNTGERRCYIKFENRDALRTVINRRRVALAAIFQGVQHRLRAMLTENLRALAICASNSRA